MASVIAQHGLWGTWALEVAVPGLQSTGSILVVHGLRCSVACGIFPDQGSNPCLLHLVGWFFITEPPGKPWRLFKWWSKTDYSEIFSLTLILYCIYKLATLDSCLMIQSNLLSELQGVYGKKKCCFLGNSYLKVIGTPLSVPGVNLFQMGKGDYLWTIEKRQREELIGFFPIITVNFFKNEYQMAVARVNINDIVSVQLLYSSFCLYVEET